MKSFSGARRYRSLCASLVLLGLAPGCATNPQTGQASLKETFASDDPCANNARNIGIVGGAVLGALLGNKLGDGSKKSTLVGAAAGAALGGLIGHSMDARRCEIARLSKQYGMDVQISAIPASPPVPAAAVSGAASAVAPAESADKRVASAGLSISVRDDQRQFAVDSAQLEPRAAEYFAQVAAQYAYARQAEQLSRNKQATAAERADVEGLKQRRILLVGHTDDSGSSAHNAELSERRARAVGEVFRQAGVADTQIFYQGAGETLPVADNRSEAGRAQNRRVEIVDLNDEQALRRYLESRAPRLAFYRPAARADMPAPVVANRAPAPRPAERPNTRASDKAVDKTAVASTASSRVLLAAAEKPESRGFDFGGMPASSRHGGVQVGALEQPSAGFSLLPAAHAAGAEVPASCADDRVREARGVKSLRSQQEVSFTELMPGLYGGTWSDSVNGNLVALTNVAVYRDGAQPASKPTLLVYKDFKGNREAKADFRALAGVNTYRGEKALLYRVFVDGPVKCLDVVLPYQGSRETAASQLLYPRDAQLYVAEFKPKAAPQ